MKRLMLRVGSPRRLAAVLPVAVLAVAVALAVGGSSGAKPPPPNPEHFNCYGIVVLDAGSNPTVSLKDQFGSRSGVKVFRKSPPGGHTFCNPVQKSAGTVKNKKDHLRCYPLNVTATSKTKRVLLSNQFHMFSANVNLTPRQLCVPSAKAIDPAVPPSQAFKTEHFLCYRINALPGAGVYPPRNVKLLDQFGSTYSVSVSRPSTLCAPVAKNGKAVKNGVKHLACYGYTQSRPVKTIRVLNQFGPERLRTTSPQSLCLPTTKTLPKLDHFNCYRVGVLSAGQNLAVSLNDQFRKLAGVPVIRKDQAGRDTFCNPVKKNEETIRNRTNHLRCYVVNVPATAKTRKVLLSNQFHMFSANVNLTPRQLCVPSGKAIDPAVPPNQKFTTEHFVCYTITPLATPGINLYPTRTVQLQDQFGPPYGATVSKPSSLCAPVAKNGKAVKNGVEHLACYGYTQQRPPKTIRVLNQFGPERLQTNLAQRLCLPTTKKLL
jgi:hypothetical protein